MNPKISIFLFIVLILYSQLAVRALYSYVLIIQTASDTFSSHVHSALDKEEISTENKDNDTKIKIMQENQIDSRMTKIMKMNLLKSDTEMGNEIGMADNLFRSIYSLSSLFEDLNEISSRHSSNLLRRLER